MRSPETVRHSSWRVPSPPERCSHFLVFGGKALRLRGSTVCVCLGAVWVAEAELSSTSDDRRSGAVVSEDQPKQSLDNNQS